MNPNRELLSCCATLAVLAAAAPCQRVLAETLGSEHLARYGAALAAIGDIDGDGVRDLVIGEPDHDYSAATGNIDSGAAVLRSSRTGIVRSRNSGLQMLGRFGTTVAALGDVDGDGVPDWAAGSASMGTSSAGYARVMSGFDGHMLWDLTGENRSELGSSIAAVSDVNNDGRSDVAISAPHNSNVHPYGAVRTYAGDTGVYRQQFVGLSSSLMGQSIASIPDVTGDGHPDLIIGEPNFAFTGVSSGHVYLINPRLPSAGSIVWEVILPFMSGWHAGQVVAAAGDVDGDGVQDVLVGTTVGRVFVLSGTNGAVLRSHQNSDAGFGSSMAGIGDFNGDGRDDYAIGAPAANNGSGRVFVCSGTDGSALLIMDGAAASNFGAALAGIGDFDGDGRADFAVGAPLHHSGGLLLGRVSIHAFTIPAIGDTFGAGCPGSRGVPDLYVAGAPRIGASFDTRCANLPPSTPGFWLTGWSNTMAGSTPLPFDLSAFGITGCQLLVSPDASLLFVSGPLSGYVARSLIVPNLPTLAGLQFYMQAIVLDPTHAGGLSVSNGARIRVGNG